jgi:DNA-binding transcriptional ArsR family regulator
MRPRQEHDVFHAIAHPARRTILGMLRQGERQAGELAEPFGKSFSAISQHLRILKDAELVCETRVGRRRIYRISSQPLREVWSWAEEFQGLWNANLDVLERHLDRPAGPVGRRT